MSHALVGVRREGGRSGASNIAEPRLRRPFREKPNI